MTEPAAAPLLLTLRAPERPEAGVEAVRALSAIDQPFARDALREALGSPIGPVRLEALRRLPPRALTGEEGEAEETRSLLGAIVARDPSPPVRRAASRALVGCLGPSEEGAGLAALAALAASLDDPVWRVRRDGMGILLAWGTTPARREAIVSAARPLARRSGAAQGALHWLEDRWGLPRSPMPPAKGRLPDPARLAELPFWDPDPASLLASMSRTSPADLRAHLGLMPALLALQDGKPQHDALEALRALSARLLARLAGPAEASQVAALLDEPRLPFSPSWAEKFLMEAPQPLLDQTALLVLSGGAFEGRPSPPGALSWALTRLPHHRPGALLDHPDARVRASAALSLALALPEQARSTLPARLDSEPEAEARLGLIEALCRLEPPPLIEPSPRGRVEARQLAGLRARALTPAEDPGFWLDCSSSSDSGLRAIAAGALRAAGPLPSSLQAALARLSADPSPQVSLALSGRSAPLPPAPPRPPRPGSPRGSSAYFPLTMASPEPARRSSIQASLPPTPAGARPLGDGGPQVSPLGLSGRYGLPERGLSEALEAGLNLIFWEPGYEGLTRSLRSLGGSARRSLVVVAGSFESTGEAVRRDAERALSLLGVEQIPVFLLFWARSAARLSDDVLSSLARLGEEAKIGLWGVSLHDRQLALLALRKGAPAIMIRHSAAHPGAEAQVFPEAKARGAGVLTFTNLCYGQLLLPTPEAPAPRAPELYRYSLSQPGVSACVSAPRTLDELRENLSVLGAPPLGEADQVRLRQMGRAAYVDGRAFRELVRDR